MENYKCLVDNGNTLEWINCPIYDWQEYRKIYPYNGKIPSKKEAEKTLQEISYKNTLVE